MYRLGKEYDRMCHLAIDIYEDYGINAGSFPLDMDYWIKKLGIDSVPYSAYSDHKELLLKASNDAFCIPSDGINNPVIVFNDIYLNLPPSKISSSKGHELKHIVDGDLNDGEDDLADYFSKYFRCPLPYVIYLEINSKPELISKFGISGEQADYVLNNARNRIIKYGVKYFEYELRLFKQLLGDSYKEEDFELIKIKGGIK